MLLDPITLREQLIQLCEPILGKKGFELVMLEVQTGKKRFVLRFFLDKFDQPGGISIAECVKMSREIEDILDMEETVDFPYILEVSSPGVDRPLVKENDFQRFAGNKVIIHTALETNPKRHKYTGVLRGIENGLVILDIDGEELRIPFPTIKKAHVKYEW